MGRLVGTVVWRGDFLHSARLAGSALYCPLEKVFAMITVHHLNNSRSQRIIWLLEELGLPYEIKRYERDPKTNLAPA